jgi:hypothetical protein
LLKTKIEGFQAENEKLKVENKRLEDEDKEFRQLSVATDEQHEIRANLLRDKIERLQIENQELKAELVQRKTWPDFWQELKAEDPDGFELIDETLSVFVGQYLYPACYITIADLKAMMREINVNGESETKTYFGEQGNIEEKEQKENEKSCQGEKSNQDQKVSCGDIGRKGYQ